MKIGVLALQGDFSEHIAMLKRLKVEASEVRLPEHLNGLDGLIIPGGESTTIAKLAVAFLITAVGCLSSTNTPKFPGIDTFAGESYHTGAWPHEGVDFAGKRVAVIGTGATAVQAVPEIAKQAAHVWVFQRTPNYDIPGRNRPHNFGLT